MLRVLETREVASRQGPLRLTAASNLEFHDKNLVGSNWSLTAIPKLSAATAEWNLFKANFGEVSLLAALNQAYQGVEPSGQPIVADSVADRAALDSYTHFPTKTQLTASDNNKLVLLRDSGQLWRLDDYSTRTWKLSSKSSSEDTCDFSAYGNVDLNAIGPNLAAWFDTGSVTVTTAKTYVVLCHSQTTGTENGVYLLTWAATTWTATHVPWQNHDSQCATRLIMVTNCVGGGRAYLQTGSSLTTLSYNYLGGASLPITSFSYWYGDGAAASFRELRLQTTSDITIAFNTWTDGGATTSTYEVCVDGTWTVYTATNGQKVQTLSLGSSEHTVIIRESGRRVGYTGVRISAVFGTFTQVAETAPAKRFYVLGDSIAIVGGNVTPVQQAWTMQLRDKGIYAVTCHGVGSASIFSYASTDQLVASTVAMMAGCFNGTVENILWIALGYNDFGAQYGTAAFQARCGALLDALHAAYPSIKIYFQSPIPATNETGVSYSLGDYRIAIAAACATRSAWVTYVDGSAYAVPLYDGVHPSVTGNLVLARHAVNTDLGGKVLAALALSTNSCWLHPDFGRTVTGGVLTAWTDYTGKGHGITAATGTGSDTTFTNGMPATNFTVTTSFTQAPAPGTSNAHWFGFGCNPSTVSGTQQFAMGTTNLDAAPEITAGLWGYVLKGNSHNGVTGATAATGEQLIELQWDNSTLDIKRDGTQIGTKSFGGAEFHPSTIGTNGSGMIGGLASWAWCDDKSLHGVSNAYKVWWDARVLFP